MRDRHAGLILIVIGILVLMQAMDHPLNGANFLGALMIGTGFYITAKG